jgi:hypothetical protein
MPFMTTTAGSREKVQDYDLDDYAGAFFDAGLSVSAKAKAFEGFVPPKRQNVYFRRMADRLPYHMVDKSLFRLIKD